MIYFPKYVQARFHFPPLFDNSKFMLLFLLKVSLLSLSQTVILNNSLFTLYLGSGTLLYRLIIRNSTPIPNTTRNSNSCRVGAVQIAY